MNTNTAEKLSPKVGLKDVMRSANKPAPATKSKVPLIDASDQLRDNAQKVLDLKRQIDSLTTLLEEASKTLTDSVFPIRQDLCKRDFINSVKVPTTDNHAVVIVWSANYLKLKTEAEEMLIEVLGDKYQEYFKSKFLISATDKSDAELYELFGWLAPDGGETEEGLQIGQERFAKFFTVEEIIRPTERFVRDHVLMDESLREQLDNAGVKQYKASIKTR